MSSSKPKISLYNSLDERKPNKKYWFAATEVFAINMLVWANSKYLAKEDWANINYKTISENFRKGFTWDGDSFAMNQFFHPYHGSTYYNAARTNGFSFWESAPFAFCGSLMWEYAMEKERPSYNDLLNTTLSGIMLGEVMYRLSDLVIDESVSGIERLSREISATIINPVRGFNRLLYGKMWRNGTKYKNTDLFIKLSFGLNSLFFNRKISQRHSYLLTMFDINYGKKWIVEDHKKPFDYIRIHGEMSFTKGDNIIGISTSGVLKDWKFTLLNNKKNIFGFYKEFDYLENYIYKFSAASLAAELTNNTIVSKPILLQTSLALLTVFIGGSNSQYSSEVGTDYNLGPGLGVRFIISSQILDLLSINIKYKQFWLHVLNGLSGNEFIGLFKLGVNYRFAKNIFWGADFVLYQRAGIYTDYPNIYSENASVRGYLKFNL